MYRRQRDGQVCVALIGDQHDGARLGDRQVGSTDADRGADELLSERGASVSLDRLDRGLRSEHPRRIFLGEVDRGRDEVGGMRVRELDHPLTEVGLDDLHAERLEIGVELDLLGGHRLDLGHNGTLLPPGGVPADLPDDRSGLGRVFGEMDLAAHRFEPFRETFHQLRQPFEVGPTALLEVRASGGEIEVRKSFVAPAAQAGHRLDEGALQLGVVESLVDAPGEVAPGLRHALGVLRGSPLRPQPVSTPGPSIWSRRTPPRDHRRWARSRRTDARASPPGPASHCRCSP